MPNVNCGICHNIFYVKPSHQKAGYGKYCSNECRAIGNRKGRYVICEICKKEVWKAPKALKNSKSGKFFCGKSCQTKWRNEFFSGEKHYFWKGGEFIYRNNLIKTGIEQVCKRCGNSDRRVLDAHHLDKNRRNNKIENLIWLCKNCHYLVHNQNENI